MKRAPRTIMTVEDFKHFEKIVLEDIAELKALVELKRLAIRKQKRIQRSKGLV